jgi:hypothetical protein
MKTVDAEPHYQDGPTEYWTIAAIEDELAFQLSSTNSSILNENTHEIRITHKYYDRAKFVLYRINIWNPSTPPVFIINTSDLTKQLRYELERLKLHSPLEFDKVVTEVIQALMEGINQRYYRVSGVAYKISWRFDP